MRLKCVAIDDEPLAVELISTYISRFPDLEILQTFEDAVSGAEYMNRNEIDLLFLDINMPDISGIDLARALDKKPMIIFTTAYKQFAYEGFELQAVDYLLKPIDFDRFTKAVNKALDYYRYKNNVQPSSDDACIYVHSEYRMVKIVLKNIEYLESMEDYVKIHLEGLSPVLTLMPLKRILEKLPAADFKRIHRSFIVPVKKVQSVQNRKMRLSDVELPISGSYADEVKLWLKM
ncbi:two component transcriptional regulator, LytTR family [Pedobacter westerhofensis]|uniref:Two component transcriptional regulator, LytTR family n=1 Tax=Pedobacter westerhofensis TaxID=425512 RepID=A0A521F259_9SPHI|nr:LytTR family DNA-binding domain-containing protein [Pedobacter westerhofensis]SMO90253.1 two component transcriptional regulator, LytTR family [Pedobacter westerhofensis]